MHTYVFVCVHQRASITVAENIASEKESDGERYIIKEEKEWGEGNILMVKKKWEKRTKNIRKFNNVNARGPSILLLKEKYLINQCVFQKFVQMK